MKDSIVTLGIIVLGIGTILCLYPVEYTYSVLGMTIRTWVEYPYREYGFILLLVGIAVLVVGLAIPKQAKEQPSPTPSRQLVPKARFCLQCGRQVSIEAKFCPNCGKEMKTSKM